MYYYLFVQRTEKCHSKQDALCPFEHEEMILFVQTTLFQTKQEEVVPKKGKIFLFLYQVYIHQIETSLIIPEFKKLEVKCVDSASSLLFLLLGSQSKKAFIHWHVFINEL